MYTWDGSRIRPPTGETLYDSLARWQSQHGNEQLKPGDQISFQGRIDMSECAPNDRQCQIQLRAPILFVLTLTGRPHTQQYPVFRIASSLCAYPSYYKHYKLISLRHYSSCR